MNENVPSLRAISFESRALLSTTLQIFIRMRRDFCFPLSEYIQYVILRGKLRQQEDIHAYVLICTAKFVRVS